MSFLRDFKAERLIARILTARDLDAPEARRQVAKLRDLGDTGVRKLVQALASVSRDQARPIMELLARLLDNQTLPIYLEALADSGALVVERVTKVLCAGSGFDPNRLVEYFTDPRISKTALIEVLTVHKGRLDVSALLRHAYTLGSSERTPLFRVIEEAADETVLPDLINRVSGKDPMIRRFIVRVLGRFDTPEIRAVLESLLDDEDRAVRQVALESLSNMDADMDLVPLCRLLRDPDIKVQHRAIDAIIRRNDPNTMSCLIDVLHDESEYVRRAGVEVLNGIGDTQSVKDLLISIKDADWWVRARSADALAKIGGPRVVKAVVELIKDQDEFIRRSAVEILNATKDEHAMSHLIEALDDSDWWVRERAVDALASIGNKAAVPALLRMLQRDAEAAPVVIRALARLGDERVIKPVIEQLRRPEIAVRLEAIHALAELADVSNARRIRQAIEEATRGASGEVVDSAHEAIDRLEGRFASASLGTARPLPEASAITSMLQPPDTGAGVAVVHAVGRTPSLDVNALKAGTMVGDRYRFIRRVGRGAFGTVLLMEDTMISETIILKVMNPQLAADEEMIQRFVRELRLSRKITHENVIRIYDFLTVQGVFAISMEYFPSRTLGAEMEATRPLPKETAIRYARDIAAGMAAAHEVGVIHRDLKPANVLINNRGLLKIVDFGVSAGKAAKTRLTRTGILIGTPKYMAPEQVMGKTVDQRTDIYALGVMLYEMLTGSAPFTGEDQMAVMYQHVQGDVKAPYLVNPEISRTLSAVVMKMMAVQRSHRYGSMAEVRDILEKFIQ